MYKFEIGKQIKYLFADFNSYLILQYSESEFSIANSIIFATLHQDHYWYSSAQNCIQFRFDWSMSNIRFHRWL